MMQIDKRKIFYKAICLTLAVIFAIVGLIVLFIPKDVIIFFNWLSGLLTFAPMLVVDIGFYNILAVAYMYIVTLLAFLMALRPERRLLPFLLINAKLASSIISMAFFIFYRHYLLFLANGIIDGAIAIGVMFLFLYMMNERINLRLLLLDLYLPTFIKRKKLSELFKLIARAFQIDAPTVRHKSYQKMLKDFALFSRDSAENAVSRERDLQSIRQRLYDAAFNIGTEIRRELHVETLEESLVACRILYGAIGIDFQSDLFGRVTFSRCYFSDFYSPEICKIISGLDEGIISGLSHGGQLIFTQRITDGNCCCMAQLTGLELLQQGVKI